MNPFFIGMRALFAKSQKRDAAGYLFDNGENQVL